MRNLLAVVSLLAVAACSSSPAGPTSSESAALGAAPLVTVPLSFAQSEVTVKASFGGGPEVDAVLDTGSTGVWVDPSVVGSGLALDPDTSGDMQRTYGGCSHYTGPVVSTSLALGGLSATINAGVTRSVASTGKAGCPTPSPSKVLGVSAVIGIGLRSYGNALTNPLLALTAHGRWIVSMDPLGSPGGSLLLNPGDAALGFTNRVWFTADGNGGWDDTVVPFCVNQFCKSGLVDSGENTPILIVGQGGTDVPGDYANIGVPAGSTLVPPGTTLDFTINGASAYSFTVQSPAGSGRDEVRVQTGGFSQNLGVLVFRYLDVYYDADNGIIGFAPKS